MKNKNIYYICSVNSPIYGKRINEKLFIGAAYNKVCYLVIALRKCGHKGYIISLPVLNKRAGNFCSTNRHVFKENKHAVVMLKTHAFPFIRRLIGLFQFAFFCLIKVSKNDRVIFYNISPEYLLALFVLRLKNNPGFLDIEDADWNDENDLINYINRFSFSIAKLLCNKKFIVASNGIADISKIEPKNACVINGVFRDDLKMLSFEDKTNRKLRVLLGGSLSHNTGVDIFCQTLELLSDKYSNYQHKIEFVVTGYGDNEDLKNIEDCLNKSCFSSLVEYNLTQEHYNEHLLSADIGLCLKLPDSKMGQTTFPSKIIEICSSGALLVSTKVSDVPSLFVHKKNALLLDKASASDLALTLIWSVDNISSVKKIASEGQRISEENFSLASVGNKLLNFIY